MRLASLALLAGAALAVAACASDTYDDRRYEPPARTSSSGGSPLAEALDRILGGAGAGSSTSDGRYEDRYERDRIYREEMDRLEAEQRRLDDRRREIERRYGRS